MTSIPIAKPMKTPISWSRTKPLKIRLASTDHVGSLPVTMPNSVPSTASAKASTMTTAARAMPAMNLATTTRDRCGSRVKVTSPLRWLASLVTSMMMMIGRK